MATNHAHPEHGSPPQILVVEDERIVALDLAATLGELGYRVVGTAASGEAAIEQARRLVPDLVLMDIRLAGALDGIEAAAAIRRERDVPIIYLTAHADDETLRRAKDTEPLAYLIKPFRAPELRVAIELALHRHEINAKLRTREALLDTTLRSIGDGLATAAPAAKAALLAPVAAALTGWSDDPELRRAVDDIVGLAVGSAPALADPGQAPTATDIEAYNAALAERVLARLEDLQTANRELETFSYSVAHDLRSPLHWIDGFSQVLIEDHAANLGAEGVGHLRRIRDGVRRMNQLIEDLLALAQVARTEVDRRPVDLARLARGVLTELRAADRDRQVELVVPDALVVETDERLLRIALHNLLGNAWKFTAKTAPARIELGRAAVGGDDVCFVRDNGAGFDMAYADRLFGAFQRLHGTAEFEGTGLGLAIVHRAIQRTGGRIWAEAEVGRGATFYFTVAA